MCNLLEIIWVRHTAVEVPPGTCYGQTDVPLRTSFEQEAQEVRRRLEAWAPFDAVYASPLSRCMRLAAFCGYPQPQLDRRLLELDFGAWEMQRYDAITDPRLQEWYEDYLQVAATDGESFQDQLSRVSQFLEEVRARPYRRIVIFTHGGVIGCAQVWAGLVAPADVFSHIPPYGGIVTLQVPRSPR